jgi:GDP-4-dehydro-6-deoxy-D-mannose reductase
VSYSWEYPVESFNNNTNIFLNILEAVRREDIKARVLSVGSSEEYGNVSEHEVPLTETAPLKPTSPYGVARVSQELLSKVYVEGFGLDIVMTRSFNHIGPYQREVFVIPGFIKQFATAEKEGRREFILRTGDIDVVRDFSDVRDVVIAYAMLMERGLKSEVYNVCSGIGQNLSDLISLIGRIMGMKTEILRDSALGRPSENRIIVGDRTKISSLCGWKPSFSIEKTLGDTIEYWRLFLKR